MPQQTNGPDFWPLCETTKISCAYMVIYWASWFLSLHFTSHCDFTFQFCLSHLWTVWCYKLWLWLNSLTVLFIDLLSTFTSPSVFIMCCNYCFCFRPFHLAFYFKIDYASCCLFQPFCDSVHMFSSPQGCSGIKSTNTVSISKASTIQLWKTFSLLLFRGAFQL